MDISFSHVKDEVNEEKEVLDTACSQRHGLVGNIHYTQCASHWMASSFVSVFLFTYCDFQ